MAVEKEPKGNTKSVIEEFLKLDPGRGVAQFFIEGKPTNNVNLEAALALFPDRKYPDRDYIRWFDETYTQHNFFAVNVIASGLQAPNDLAEIMRKDRDELVESLRMTFGKQGMPYLAFVLGKDSISGEDLSVIYCPVGMSAITAVLKIRNAAQVGLKQFVQWSNS